MILSLTLWTLWMCLARFSLTISPTSSSLFSLPCQSALSLSLFLYKYLASAWFRFVSAIVSISRFFFSKMSSTICCFILFFRPLTLILAILSSWLPTTFFFFFATFLNILFCISMFSVQDWFCACPTFSIRTYGFLFSILTFLTVFGEFSPFLLLFSVID